MRRRQPGDATVGVLEREHFDDARHGEGGRLLRPRVARRLRPGEQHPPQARGHCDDGQPGQGPAHLSFRLSSGGEDLFLLPREMRQVMHGDRIVVRVSGIDHKGRREGTIVEVLERAHERIVGKLHIEGEVGFVVADNRRITHEIIVPGSELDGAEEGDIVVVELMVQPSPRTQAVGRIVEVIGAHLAPGMETDVAIRSHDIPVEWPEEVLNQIEGLSEKVPQAQKEGRTDLRQLITGTGPGPATHIAISDDGQRIVFVDYRDLTGEYDKLVSVEMIEAVGHHYYDTYFRTCSDLLKPDGLMLLQADVCARAGQVETGQRALEQAEAWIERTGMRPLPDDGQGGQRDDRHHDARVDAG